MQSFHIPYGCIPWCLAEAKGNEYVSIINKPLDEMVLT